MERASNGHLGVYAHPAFGHPKVQIVGVHSYRGGSGKTTVSANLAFLAARAGAKVAVVDADLQVPALHIPFGVGPKRVLHSVSEFVKGQCEMEEVPIDLSRELGIEGPEAPKTPQTNGRLYLLPASVELPTITSILFEGYDVARLNESLRKLAQDLDLDLLILDTHHGINRETLMSLATSDTVLIVLRPDGQDHQGAAVIVQMAKKVGVPDCLLVPNMIANADLDEVGSKVEAEFDAPVAGVLPWCGELSGCACEGLFAVNNQDDPFTAALERVSARLLPSEVGAGDKS